MKKVNTISPNEMNKYTYCKYQWYYEKKYGTKTLRELVKQRNEELGLDNKAYSNFQRGLDYHSNYHFKYRLKQLMIKLLQVLILLMLIFAVVLVLRIKNG
jgi:hypothetical protein